MTAEDPFFQNFRRCLRTADGRPLMRFEQIAQELDYADRRNVPNFWMEFEACDGDLEAFLVRKKKVDAEGVTRGEPMDPPEGDLQDEAGPTGRNGVPAYSSPWERIWLTAPSPPTTI